jgi:hypothetical protein
MELPLFRLKLHATASAANHTNSTCSLMLLGVTCALNKLRTRLNHGRASTYMTEAHPAQWAPGLRNAHLYR